MNITVSDLRAWGAVTPEKFLPYINKYSNRFSINTPKRILCFWANVLHESGDLKFTKEISSGVQYEGRKDLGNVNTGDGAKYKGRGLLQLTGRRNYTAFSSWYKLVFKEDINFVDNPEYLEQPEYAVLSAFWFWESNRLDKWADEGKFREVCSIINTGRPNSFTINGFDDRIEKFKKINDWLKSII